MALMHCPECGREISDQASACPGCGLPAAVDYEVLVVRVLEESAAVNQLRKVQSQMKEEGIRRELKTLPALLATECSHAEFEELRRKLPALHLRLVPGGTGQAAVKRTAVGTLSRGELFWLLTAGSATGIFLVWLLFLLLSQLL